MLSWFNVSLCSWCADVGCNISIDDTWWRASWCDGPCGDDGQARGLALMHHAVVKDNWRFGTEGPEKPERSHEWSPHDHDLRKSTWMVRWRWSRRRSSQDGRRWQARVGWLWGGSAEYLKGSKLGGGRTRVDFGGDGFTSLGLKIGNASGAVRWRCWRARGIIAKLALRLSKVVKVAYLSDARVKTWTILFG